MSQYAGDAMGATPARRRARDCTSTVDSMTIVMPTLDQAPYIERALDSILSQKRDFELECIVVDGGSTDGTLDVLAGYGDSIRWMSRPDNGQSHALNRGLTLATGTVMGWLNSDDAYEPGALQLVADVFRADAAAHWVYGKVRIIDEDGHEIRHWITVYKNLSMRRFGYAKLLRENWISQMGVFWRRSAFEVVGPFDEDLHLTMDYDYWLRLAGKWPGRFIDQYLADFRWYSTSKSGSTFRDQFAEELGVAMRHAEGRHRWSLAVHRLYVTRTICAYEALRLLRL
jgi:glycosyltransferase involved in cell wall biosynthesis